MPPGDAREKCPCPRLSHLPVVLSVPTCMPWIRCEPPYQSQTFSVSAGIQQVSFLWNMGSASATSLCCVTPEQLELEEKVWVQWPLSTKGAQIYANPKSSWTTETYWASSASSPLIIVERVTPAEAEHVRTSFVTQRLQQSTWRRAVTCSLLSRLHLLLPSYCSVRNVIVKSKIRVSHTIILSQINNESKARDWNQNPLSSKVLTLWIQHISH